MSGEKIKAGESFLRGVVRDAYRAGERSGIRKGLEMGADRVEPSDMDACASITEYDIRRQWSRVIRNILKELEGE